MTKLVVFEALLPNGTHICVFDDGSNTGLPDGTCVYNGFISLFDYAHGLTKKALNDGLITAEQSAHLFQGRFPALDSAMS